MEKSSLKFLADENISPVLIAILNKLNERSISSIHRGGYDYAGKPDEEWLPLATERGYICVTCDRKMLLERGIASVLIEIKARVIFLGEHFSKSRCWDQALWLLRYWRSIRTYAESMEPGQMIRVHKNGKIVPVSLETLEEHNGHKRKKRANPRRLKRSDQQSLFN